MQILPKFVLILILLLCQVISVHEENFHNKQRNKKDDIEEAFNKYDHDDDKVLTK